MNWNDRLPVAGAPPAPVRWGRWALACVGALLLGVGGFMFLVVQPDPALESSDILSLAAAPLLVVAVLCCLRGLLHQGVQGHHRDCEKAAQSIRLAWQDWAQQALGVQACSVLLPDHVSASVLIQENASLPERRGVARRIEQLEASVNKAQAGLELLQPALTTALKALPAGQALRVTVLSDTPDEQALRGAWRQTWAHIGNDIREHELTIAAWLPYDGVDNRLRLPDLGWELIVVLQTQGGAAYSDGLASLLLAPQANRQSPTGSLPLVGLLSRPMPLDITTLDSQLPLFMHAQIDAVQATALLADHADWQAGIGKVVSVGHKEGAALTAQQCRILESFCGVPGPLSSWLAAALALEMAQHRRSPVLMVNQQDSQQWISTVIPAPKTTN